MADTELYVTKVRTKNGDKQIDYNALANLPKFDDDWKEEYGVANTDTSATKADLTKLETELLARIVETDNTLSIHSMACVTKKQLDEKGYLTETQLNEKGYVTDSTLASKGYLTETQLNSKGYVTESVLSSQGYVTATQLTSGENLVATDEKPGVVKPGEGLTVIDGTLHVDKHPLEDLSNMHICQDGMPDSSAIVDGHWYLVKVVKVEE
jgi:hypothetical protein